MENKSIYTTSINKGEERSFLLITNEIFEFLIKCLPSFNDYFPENYSVGNIKTMQNDLNVNFKDYDTFFLVYDGCQKEQVNFVQPLLFQIKKINKNSIVILLVSGESVEEISMPNLYFVNFNYNQAQNIFILLEFILINFFQKDYVFNIDIHFLLEAISEDFKEIFFYEIQVEEDKLNDIKKSIKTEISKQELKNIFLLVETHPDATYLDLSLITDSFKKI